MLPFWFGTLAGVTPWISIAYNIVAAETVPGFVYGIVLVQACLFFSFGLNQWLQYRGAGRWSDYAYGEKTYLVLSLAAKSLLSWQISAASWGSRPGCRTCPAHRYLASVRDPGVGGDWFDIIPLDERRTGVVIGDVMGRGLEAAAVMGQLRAACHALARTGCTPGELMTGLDAFVNDLAGKLVTCLYLVIDQEAGEVTLCSAGHLPVIALPPDGHARRLGAPVGVPLGVDDPAGSGLPFEKASHPLPPSSTLVLYTDGLVERPGTDIDAQIDVLVHTLDLVLKGVPADAETLDRAAARRVRTLIPDTEAHDDDVTLLLLAVPDPEGQEVRPVARFFRHAFREHLICGFTVAGRTTGGCRRFLDGHLPRTRLDQPPGRGSVTVRARLAPPGRTTAHDRRACPRPTFDCTRPVAPSGRGTARAVDAPIGTPGPGSVHLYGRADKMPRVPTAAPVP